MFHLHFSWAVARLAHSQRHMDAVDPELRLFFCMPFAHSEEIADQDVSVALSSKFAKRSEQLNPQRARLLDDLIDTDIAAIEAELQALQTALRRPRKAQAQSHRVVSRISTHVDPSRIGQHPLPMRPCTHAHR